MKQEEQIIMLPSKERSLILNNKYKFTPKHGNPLVFDDNSIDKIEERGYIPQHLYLVTDEEIKVGNYAYDLIDNTIFQMNNQTGIDLAGDKVKKIIATTDKYLYQYVMHSEGKVKIALAQIPQSFIEEFCAKGGIDKVMVEYTNKCKTTPNTCEWSHCRVSGECNNTKTTDIFYLKVNPDNTVNIFPVKDSWNREEVETLLYECYLEGISNSNIKKGKDKLFDDWVKENL